MALERYFKAASEGMIPWSEICDNVMAEEENLEDPARPGQLHPGFLQAAIYESLVEVEASRALRELKERKSKRKAVRFRSRLTNVLSRFSQADRRDPTVDMESIEGDFNRGAQAQRGFVEQQVKEKPQLCATSEEMYMAMMLLLRNIFRGYVDLYDLRKKAGFRTRLLEMPDEERPIQDILEEISTRQENFEEEEEMSQESTSFEAPDPEPIESYEDDRSVPALLRPSPRTEPSEVDGVNPDVMLARTLGMQNASGARENLAQMSQSHRKHFEEVIELKAEVNRLRRSLVQARADLGQLENQGHPMNNVRSASSLSREGTSASMSPATQQMEVLSSLGLVRPQSGPVKATPLASPRTPRLLKGHGPRTKEYVTPDDGRKSIQKYPVQKWPSQSKKKTRTTEDLAYNMQGSTTAVADNSFWSKAAT